MHTRAHTRASASTCNRSDTTRADASERKSLGARESVPPSLRRRAGATSNRPHARERVRSLSQTAHMDRRRARGLDLRWGDGPQCAVDQLRHGLQRELEEVQQAGMCKPLGGQLEMVCRSSKWGVDLERVQQAAPLPAPQNAHAHTHTHTNMHVGRSLATPFHSGPLW